MKRFGEITRALIRDYHDYQGDKRAVPVRVIKHPDGGRAVLVHFRDGKGVKCSSLDMIAYGNAGEYVTELFSSTRKDENIMIQTYLNL